MADGLPVHRVGIMETPLTQAMTGSGAIWARRAGLDIAGVGDDEGVRQRQCAGHILVTNFVPRARS